MIYDAIKNYKNYEAPTRLYKALSFLAETDWSQVEFGRYELDGDNIFYLVQDYTPKGEEAKAEAHRKYIDIQAMIEGTEIIGIAPIEGEKTEIEAKPEKDAWFYTCDTQNLELYAGSFMIFFPNDIHRPGMAIGASEPVTKVVVKVKA